MYMKPMSRTSTTTTETMAIQRPGTILLSSPKRRRYSNDADNMKTRPSEKKIWEWTLTTANPAKCYVRDAMSASASSEGFDFFWLGSIPCRKFEVYGMVVGIQVLETKVIYTIDDGTGVIDCSHRPPQPPQSKEHKKSMEHTKPLLPPPGPQRMSRIGGVVKAVGRIQPKFETRIIIIDTITPSSFSAQLTHWKAVRDLHKTHYNSSEPFVIPTVIPETPRKAQRLCVTTPTRSPVVAASPVALLSQSTAASSPVNKAVSPPKSRREVQVPQSPAKLRHPSRLHSYQLTDSAFRLYVKHIIDNAPDDLSNVGGTPEDPIPIDSDSDSELKELYTPTRTFTSVILGVPAKSHTHSLRSVTPQPKLQTASPSLPLTTGVSNVCQGITLSYLRRVPELSLMARRVVKQRVREESKKTREVAVKLTSKSSGKQPAKHLRLDRASLAAKKKRLFQWAICELLREGSIVLWDGPKRDCLPTSNNADDTMLWQFSSANSTDNSLFSNASKSNSTLDDSEDLVISDPEPDEEAYVSTKSELLAPFVTKALTALASEPTKRVLKRNELNGGSTKKEILAYLQRDDKWAFLGEWNVDEALEYMEREELVWRVTSDRWLLTQ